MAISLRALKLNRLNLFGQESTLNPIKLFYVPSHDQILISLFEPYMYMDRKYY